MGADGALNTHSSKPVSRSYRYILGSVFIVCGISAWLISSSFGHIHELNAAGPGLLANIRRFRPHSPGRISLDLGREPVRVVPNRVHDSIMEETEALYEAVNADVEPILGEEKDALYEAVNADVEPLHAEEKVALDEVVKADVEPLHAEEDSTEVPLSGSAISASIASYVRGGSWLAPTETPVAPHMQPFSKLFAEGNVVPEPGCEDKWGDSWLRTLANSRKDVCTPDKEKVKRLAENEVMKTKSRGWYRPRAGPFAWETRGNWTGALDHEYGVRLGTSIAAKVPDGGPQEAPGRITRWMNDKSDHFEWMRNVAVDFSLKDASSGTNHFQNGFIQVGCTLAENVDLFGLDHGAQPAFKSIRILPTVTECDSWIHTPTIVLQHEDIGNTYHNLADFWRAWVSVALLSAPMCASTDTSPNASTADAVLSNDPTLAQGPRGALRDIEQDVHAFQPQERPCPSGTVRIPGLDPDHIQFMTLDARLMCGTIDIHGQPIQDENKEDCLGPYFPQYNTWFGQGVVRARDFGKEKQKVCFSALGFATATPGSHIWDHFWLMNPCRTSPILRAYSTYVAGRWGLAGAGPRAYRLDKCRQRVGRHLRRAGGSLSAPATEVADAPFTLKLPEWVCPENSGRNDSAGSKRNPLHQYDGDDCAKPYVRVVYVARKKKPFSTVPVVNRVITNEADLFTALLDAASAVGIDVDVIEADFALMPYEDQVRLTRSSSLLVGMHGAGLVHGLDMADADECGGITGVVELFPKDMEATGIRNMNVQVGRKYWAWQNGDTMNEIAGSGTQIDKAGVQAVLTQALNDVVRNRTACAAVHAFAA